MPETKDTLASLLREIKLPAAAKSTARQGRLELEFAREQAISKITDAERYIAVWAAFVALHDEKAGAEIRSIAAVLA